MRETWSISACDENISKACCDARQVVHKLSISTPQPELVDGYLLTIAQKYGVQWVPPERPMVGSVVRLALIDPECAGGAGGALD